MIFHKMKIIYLYFFVHSIITLYAQINHSVCKSNYLLLNDITTANCGTLKLNVALQSPIRHIIHACIS
jgi:hypothetical protein